MKSLTRLPSLFRDQRKLHFAIRSDAMVDTQDGRELKNYFSGRVGDFSLDDSIDLIIRDSFGELVSDFHQSLRIITDAEPHINNRTVSEALGMMIEAADTDDKLISRCRLLVGCGLIAGRTVFPAVFTQRIDKICACGDDLENYQAKLSYPATGILAKMPNFQRFMLLREQTLGLSWCAKQDKPECAADWYPHGISMDYKEEVSWRAWRDDAVALAKLQKPSNG